MKILITGGTGFIGQRLVRELQKLNHDLFLLVRPGGNRPPLENVQYVEGNVEDSDVIGALSPFKKILPEVDCLIHMAALYDLTASLPELYMRNVVGTQNVLNLAKKIPNLKYLHYFSTYAVNPQLEGIVREEDLSKAEHPFPDEYLRTKNDAEHIVRTQLIEGVETIIHRPGVIVGESTTGVTDNLNGPYYFLNFVRNLKNSKLHKRLPLLPLPLRNESLLPLLPVDVLAKWVAHIVSHPKGHKIRTYHEVSDEIIQTRTFIEEGMRLLGVETPILPIPVKKIFSPFFPLLKMPPEIIFYMHQGIQLDRSNLMKDYPELHAPRFQDYFPKLIGWLERENA